MVVRRNIGKLIGAIEKGVKASYYAQPSASVDPTLYAMSYNMGDWTHTDTFPDAFIFGIHKWGDTTRKVREVQQKKAD
jgi:hypothetical protein